MNKYLDCEKYKVEKFKCDGIKTIVIDGFCYKNDEGFQWVSCSGCYIGIKDVAENGRDAVDDALMSCKEYQYDMAEKEVDGYYDGLTELAMTDVDENTPCGWYVDPTCKNIDNSNTIQQL